MDQKTWIGSTWDWFCRWSSCTRRRTRSGKRPRKRCFCKTSRSRLFAI